MWTERPSCCLNGALVRADSGAVDKRPRAENSNGWIKQSEQEPHHDENQADTAAVALAKHRTQPTNNTTQQSGLTFHCRLCRFSLPINNTKYILWTIIFVTH